MKITLDKPAVYFVPEKPFVHELGYCHIHVHNTPTYDINRVIHTNRKGANSIPDKVIEFLHFA
jgi:hypothetical protein